MKLPAPVVAAALLLAAPAWAQNKPHVHGQVKVDIAVQAGTLTVMVEAPLDSLVGFEHRPRTPAQRKAAADALALMNDVTRLVKTPAAAGCTAAAPEIDAAPLQPAPAGQPGAKEAAHADLEATYTFSCTAPGALSALELGLFDAFPRIQRIDVQVAGPQGQRKQPLRRPAREVKLTR
jgi:Protein of unknown function (DUF2796)